jgi:hypothetical protein
MYTLVTCFIKFGFMSISIQKRLTMAFLPEKIIFVFFSYDLLVLNEAFAL